jgi:hypothetical protein
MVLRLIRHRPFAGILVAGFMLAAAGCQSGDGANGLGLGLDGSTDNDLQAPKVNEASLRTYCPQVTLREGTAFFSTFAKGGDGDPAKLAYQASISDVTRSCTAGGGLTTINVAVAGRVVPGPAGAPGSITMPIRIVVVRGADILYSQLHKYEVAVGQAATQFLFNDPNVAIPTPEQGGTVQVYAGYDEGPPKKTN